MWPYGARTDPLQSQHGLFTGCLWSLNPYGARKLIMHVLKLYGPRTAPHGAPTGPVSGRTISIKHSPRTAREHENNPYGARECDVTEALDVVNSPWTARAGTVRGPYGHKGRPFGIFANSVCANSLTCPPGSWGCRTVCVCHHNHYQFQFWTLGFDKISVLLHLPGELG